MRTSCDQTARNGSAQASLTYACKMGQGHEFEDVSPEATAESDAGLTAFERIDLAAAERHLRAPTGWAVIDGWQRSAMS